MTLAQLSETLVSNKKLTVTLLDTKGDVVVKYNADGYEALDAQILGMTVSKITVEADYLISVVIAE